MRATEELVERGGGARWESFRLGERGEFLLKRKISLARKSHGMSKRGRTQWVRRAGMERKENKLPYNRRVENGKGLCGR